MPKLFSKVVEKHRRREQALVKQRMELEKLIKGHEEKLDAFRKKISESKKFLEEAKALAAAARVKMVVLDHFFNAKELKRVSEKPVLGFKGLFDQLEQAKGVAEEVGVENLLKLDFELRKKLLSEVSKEEAEVLHSEEHVDWFSRVLDRVKEAQLEEASSVVVNEYESAEGLVREHGDRVRGLEHWLSRVDGERVKLLDGIVKARASLERVRSGERKAVASRERWERLAQRAGVLRTRLAGIKAVAPWLRALVARDFEKTRKDFEKLAVVRSKAAEALARDLRKTAKDVRLVGVGVRFLGRHWRKGVLALSGLALGFLVGVHGPLLYREYYAPGLKVLAGKVEKQVAALKRTREAIEEAEAPVLGHGVREEWLVQARKALELSRTPPVLPPPAPREAVKPFEVPSISEVKLEELKLPPKVKKELKAVGKPVGKLVGKAVAPVTRLTREEEIKWAEGLLEKARLRNSSVASEIETYLRMMKGYRGRVSSFVINRIKKLEKEL